MTALIFIAGLGAGVISTINKPLARASGMKKKGIYEKNKKLLLR